LYYFCRHILNGSILGPSSRLSQIFSQQPGFFGTVAPNTSCHQLFIVNIQTIKSILSGISGSHISFPSHTTIMLTEQVSVIPTLDEGPLAAMPLKLPVQLLR
jgi:hypothetical protein